MKFNSVLIVEDEIIAMQYLKGILQSLNITSIFEAKNAKDAEHIINLVKIDLVFMDINIQGVIDGIECAKRLNQSYFLPIIFTTAHNDSETIKETSQTNIFGYLSKPFDEKDVEIALSIVTKLLQNSKTKHINQNRIIVTLDSQYTYDLDTKTLFINNIPLKLTKKEIDILYLFCTNINNNISYNSLKELIWNSKDISNSTIRDTISRIKKKTPNLNIENIINFGYVLKV